MTRGVTTSALRLTLLALLLGTSGFDLLWSHNRDVAHGNELLAAGKAQEALGAYDQALKRLPDDPGVRYNRALALAELGQLDEAQKDLMRASESPDAGMKAKAHFNLGNTFARQEKWREAVEAYKRALATDPRYFDAKWNLELAARKLKEQQEKEKKKQEEQKQKQDEEQKQKQDEEQKKKQDEEQQQQQGQDGGTPQPKPDQQGDKPDQPASQPQRDDQQQPKAGQDREQPKPQPGQEQEQPKPQPRAGGDANQPPPPPPPQSGQRRAVDTVLDALEKNERNLPLERLRMRSRRRPERDW